MTGEDSVEPPAARRHGPTRPATPKPTPLQAGPTAAEPALHTAAQTALEVALARPARLGSARLVCIDGPAGSGKTTFADRLVRVSGASAHSVSLVHLDDVYAGWSGLGAVGDRLRRLVVEPMLQGRSGRFPRWDWHRSEWAEEVEVAAADLVVLEGVGSGHPALAPYAALLVWVEASDDLRLRRGLGRDGAALLPQWRTWMAEESALHARERTRERADLVVDGVTGAVTGPALGR